MKKWAIGIFLAVIIVILAGAIVYSLVNSAKNLKDVKDINREMIRALDCMKNCPVTLDENPYQNQTCLDVNCSIDNCTPILQNISKKYPERFMGYPNGERKISKDMIWDNGDYRKCFSLRCDVPEFNKCLSDLKVKYHYQLT